LVLTAEDKKTPRDYS